MRNNYEKFKPYLKKIGSGENTSKSLAREESANALKLILREEASPAQIGAFMIAHRIRRPEPQELAGMLDTYLELGPNFSSRKGEKRPICFCMPFDGRTRTSPIYPLTTLILVCAGQPVVLQGGKRMPIKYGVTTAELFQALGLDLTKLTLKQLENYFAENQLALIHQPTHFKQADALIKYRDELGKRPPLASMELIWSAHKGEHLLVSGFVHPPTEARALKTLELINEKEFIFVKGLEGGIDLPSSRSCITSRVHHNKFQRIILHPKEHDCQVPELSWRNLDEWVSNAIEALNNKGPFVDSLRWNAGVYLWFSGAVGSLKEGIITSEKILSSGEANNTLKKLINSLSLIKLK